MASEQKQELNILDTKCTKELHSSESVRDERVEFKKRKKKGREKKISNLGIAPTDYLAVLLLLTTLRIMYP